MTTLTAAGANRDGVEIAASAVPCSVGGDAFLNDGQTIACFTNASGAPINVTFAVGQYVDVTLLVSPRIVSIPAGSTTGVGTFPPLYNDVNGLVQMTYSSVVDLFVKCIKVPPA